MVFNTKAAFDAWEKKGNPGWNWDTMLPYLRRFHTHHQPSKEFAEISDISHKDAAIDSTEGPIQTSYSRTTDVDKAWYEAWGSIMKEFKYEGDQLGGFAPPAAIDPRTKTRSYAATAYYSSNISSRTNLRVITEALVEKIVLQKGNEVIATGVQFASKSGEKFTIKAKKEVILSAGVVQSPQLLEISGIGSEKLLRQHKIDVVIDNPNVGENLQDHAMIGMSFEAADGVQTAEAMLRDPKIFESLLAMYQKDRSGPLGHFFVDSAHLPVPEVFGPEGYGSLQTLLQNVSAGDHRSTSDKLHEHTTLNLLSQPDGASAHYFMAKVQFNSGTSTKIGEIMSAKTPGNYITPMFCLNFPFSRGSIHIASPSPTDKPIIDPKYFSHPMDLELAARHLQFMSVIVQTPPLSKYFKEGGRRIPAHAFVGNKTPTLDEAKELVRENSFTNYHPMGTCAMGKREEGGVVNERLIVHGTKNLRIVDSSIFPLLPRGNPITSNYAVAERAADLMKEDWNSGYVKLL
jgi:choline dehydrogenase-like flavoprotein